MHESTVSRVTSNKYISTPRGLFELKYFFTASIQAMNGAESHSAEAVRDRIREMIENEEPREILSDDRIVALLTADGVNIARRTVGQIPRGAAHSLLGGTAPTQGRRRAPGRVPLGRFASVKACINTDIAARLTLP